ncbi:hypothetical protein BC940DRAFT_286793 [Gongronella butleri]|nr:hypothetical protein BC940DRAFT_286793 [Gongronella butleri]
MERRPKRPTSSNIDYRDGKRPREPKLTVLEPAKPEPISDQDLDRCQRLLDDLIKLRDEEDETYFISTHFRELPPKDEFPDYYQTIHKPIALDGIQTKIKNKTYHSFQDMKDDLRQMINNAKRYNIEETQVYQDAVILKKFIKAWDSSKPTKNVLKISLQATPKGDSSAKEQTKAHPSPTMIQIKPPTAHTVRVATNIDPAVSKELAQPLMDAVEADDAQRVRDLLSQGADPNLLFKTKMFDSTFTWGPLHCAAYRGRYSVCRSLLSRGANVELNDTWYKGTPLAWAAFGGHLQIARMLIKEYHANVDAKNIHGQVPFDLVSEPDDPQWRGIFIELAPGEEPPRPPRPAATLTQNGKRRGRPPKSETESRREAEKPTDPIDLNQFDTSLFMRSVLNAYRRRRDKENRIYMEIFEELPDRKEYADYYEAIKQPVSLETIEDKMRENKYKTMNEWSADYEKMFENAMEYNENGSRIYRDAKLMLRLLPRLKTDYMFAQHVPESQFEDVMKIDLSTRTFDPHGLIGKRAQYYEQLERMRQQLKANAPIDAPVSASAAMAGASAASMMAMPSVSAPAAYYTQAAASAAFYSAAPTAPSAPSPLPPVPPMPQQQQQYPQQPQQQQRMPEPSMPMAMPPIQPADMPSPSAPRRVSQPQKVSPQPNQPRYPLPGQPQPMPFIPQQAQHPQQLPRYPPQQPTFQQHPQLQQPPRYPPPQNAFQQPQPVFLPPQTPSSHHPQHPNPMVGDFSMQQQQQQPMYFPSPQGASPHAQHAQQQQQQFYYQQQQQQQQAAMHGMMPQQPNMGYTPSPPAAHLHRPSPPTMPNMIPNHQAAMHLPSRPLTPELAALLNIPQEKARYLAGISLKEDEQELFQLDGGQVAHNVVIPEKTDKVDLRVQLPPTLQSFEQERVSLQVTLNKTMQVQPVDPEQDTNGESESSSSPSTPQSTSSKLSWPLTLVPGMNECRVLITINATDPSNPNPDIRTQTYQLFINHIS